MRESMNMNTWTYKDGVFTNQAGDQVLEKNIPDFQGQRNWPGPYRVQKFVRITNVEAIIRKLWNDYDCRNQPV